MTGGYTTSRVISWSTCLCRCWRRPKYVWCSPSHKGARSWLPHLWDCLPSWGFSHPLLFWFLPQTQFWQQRLLRFSNRDSGKLTKKFNHSLENLLFRLGLTFLYNSVHGKLLLWVFYLRCTTNLVWWSNLEFCCTKVLKVFITRPRVSDLGIIFDPNPRTSSPPIPVLAYLKGNDGKGYFLMVRVDIS